MNPLLKLFSFEHIDILLKNLTFRIEDELLCFYRDSDLTQQNIVFDTDRNLWFFRENLIYTGGDQETKREYDSLEELIKETIIPYFYQIPDSHVRNIFTLWTKEWVFEQYETEDEILLKFRRKNEYFSYPLMNTKSQSYIQMYNTSWMEIFDKSCFQNGVHCSKNYFLENILQDNYK